MKKVFICSPYRGDIEQNRLNALKYARHAVLEGYLPIVPHIYFTQFLDENSPEERAQGIALGIELMKYCNEMWVFGEPTAGMQNEIKAWGKRKIKYV